MRQPLPLGGLGLHPLEPALNSRQRTPRFYYPPHEGGALHPARTLQLREDQSHHALHVLRIKLGATLILFDGQGGEYTAQVCALGKRSVEVQLDAHHPIEREALRAVTLLQGISASDRMDLCIQKAVELGIAAIQPLDTERSVVRVKGERALAKRLHWERVAIAACEQCGRNRVPQVLPIIDIAQLRPSTALSLELAPDASVLLREPVLAQPDLPIALAVGPEAGFSAQESEQLGRLGFQAVRLGPRILRTETAGPAALAAIAALSQEF